MDYDSYRFGYQIRPLLTFIPKEKWELYSMLVFTKTRQNLRKQYILIPIDYKDTFLKQANDQVLKELEERRKIKDEAERDKALKELEDEVKNRLKGSLFENDASQTENLALQLEKSKNHSKKTSKKKNKEGEGKQGSLFG